MYNTQEMFTTNAVEIQFFHLYNSFANQKNKLLTVKILRIKPSNIIFHLFTNRDALGKIRDINLRVLTEICVTLPAEVFARESILSSLQCLFEIKSVCA